MTRFGLDPLSAAEEQTARTVAADPLRATLIGILSTWQRHHQEGSWYDADAQRTRSSWEVKPNDRIVYDRLGRAIRLTRLECGGAYARWQGLLDRKDWKGLAAFGSTPEMLDLGPNPANALTRDLQNTARDYEATRGVLRAAAERYPNSVSIRFDLATSCESMSPPRNLEALEQYAALAALKPNALLFQYQLGTTFAALGDVTQAILIHRKAAERGSVVSARAMGQLYLEDLHDLDGAIASYRRALELASTTPLGAKATLSCPRGSWAASFA